MTLVLIGNKTDLSEKKEVSFEDGNAFALKHNMMFFETSAKNDVKVGDCFKKSAETIFEKIGLGKIDPKNEAFGIKFGSLDKKEYGLVRQSSVNANNKKKCC